MNCYLTTAAVGLAVGVTYTCLAACKRRKTKVETVAEGRFPPDYVEAYTTPKGNKVWWLYNKAGQTEKAHKHDGCHFYGKEQPIEVFSYPDNKLLYATDKVGESIQAIFLPPSGMHYARTPYNYSAVLIEIRVSPAESDETLALITGPEIRESCPLDPKTRKITLEQAPASLQTGDRDVFLTSEVALTLLTREGEKIKPVGQGLGPHFVYHLPYWSTIKIPAQQSFFLLEAYKAKEQG